MNPANKMDNPPPANPETPLVPVVAAVAPAKKPTSTDNVTVNTPNGHTVVIKGFVSGRAMEDMKRIFMENVEFELDAETGEPKKDRRIIKGTSIVDIDRRAVELFVISVDGITESAFDLCIDLPSDDYDAVQREVEKITGPLVMKTSKS
jgi:hypothetical protein